jgi:DHA1 family multidrug resistance protein-like MFS transporter
MNLVTKPLRILLAADTLVLIAGAMIVPYYALFVQKIGGDILDTGLAAGVYAVAAGFATLAAGRWSDRTARKEFIVAGSYLVLALCFVAYTFVHSIWQLLAVQVVVGLAQATYIPAYDALYGSHVGGIRTASSRWSFWEASNFFAIAIGALVGALIVHLTNFSGLLLTMAGLCIVSGVYLFTLPRRAV